MRFWLEIQRRSGEIDKREIEPSAIHGEAEGRCPGCGSLPFLVAGIGVESMGGGVFRAGGKCVGCDDSVGYIFAKEETLFGTEEDRAVLEFGRGRVYSEGAPQR